MPPAVADAAPLPDLAPGVLPAGAEHLSLAPTAPGGPRVALTRLPGDGEPVLWLHPSRTQRRVFDHALAASRLGRPVIAPDLAGHGDAVRPATPHGLDDHVDDLAALVEALGLARFAIVGQATGATLGLLLASRLGPRVSALALGDVALGIRPAVLARVEAEERAAAAGYAAPEDAMAATPFAERWGPGVRAHWLATALARGADGRWRWRHDAATVIATMRDMTAADRWSEVRVEAPALLFRGAENTAIEAGEIDRALAHLPRAEAVELAGADHRLCQDAPEAFAALVDGFLARAEAPA